MGQFCTGLRSLVLLLLTDTMTWACGDIGQVSLDVYNPMPFELKVFNMVRHICLYLLPNMSMPILISILVSILIYLLVSFY